MAPAIERRVSRGLRLPCLARVLVGENPASRNYVRRKREACERVGTRSRPLRFDATVGDATVGEETLMDIIDVLNADGRIDCILRQQRLQARVGTTHVVERFVRTRTSMASPLTASAALRSASRCCDRAPFGIMELLGARGETLHGRRALVAGAPNIGGRPLALALLLAGATTTVGHRFTVDPAERIA